MNSLTQLTAGYFLPAGIAHYYKRFDYSKFYKEVNGKKFLDLEAVKKDPGYKEMLQKDIEESQKRNRSMQPSYKCYKCGFVTKSEKIIDKHVSLKCPLEND